MSGTRLPDTGNGRGKMCILIRTHRDGVSPSSIERAAEVAVGREEFSWIDVVRSFSLALDPAPRSLQLGGSHGGKNKSRLLARDYAGLRSDCLRGGGGQIQNLYTRRSAIAKLPVTADGGRDTRAKERERETRRGSGERKRKRETREGCKKIPTRAHC